MTLYVLDTDTMTLYERGHPLVLRNVIRHANDQIVTSVTTVEEQFGGWQRRLSATKDDAGRAQIYTRFANTVECLSGWTVLPLTVASLQRYRSLRHLKLNVGSNDLRIAAVALDAKGTVVTRNRRDFIRVPGLTIEDWSV